MITKTQIHFYFYFCFYLFIFSFIFVFVFSFSLLLFFVFFHFLFSFSFLFLFSKNCPTDPLTYWLTYWLTGSSPPESGGPRFKFYFKIRSYKLHLHFLNVWNIFCYSIYFDLVCSIYGFKTLFESTTTYFVNEHSTI